MYNAVIGGNMGNIVILKQKTPKKYEKGCCWHPKVRKVIVVHTPCFVGIDLSERYTVNGSFTFKLSDQAYTSCNRTLESLKDIRSNTLGYGIDKDDTEIISGVDNSLEMRDLRGSLINYGFTN